MPQRQTALVAKQVAEVDLLTDGRFRFGVGLGWNAVEYEALGKDFATRGATPRRTGQLLRRLWTKPSATFDGTDEQVTGAGLAPMPVQRPIPIWFGARSPPAYRRRPPGRTRSDCSCARRHRVSSGPVNLARHSWCRGRVTGR